MSGNINSNLNLFSYRQNISVSFVAQEMAFKTTEECLSFLEPFSLVYTDETKQSIDCKASTTLLANIT